MGTQCWTTRPHCGYQKGISFNATKCKLKLDLASFTVFQGLTKMPPKRLKPPKPQSSAKKFRGKSNHKGDHLQLWSVENMRNALVCDRIRISLCVCSGALPSNYLCGLYARPGTPMYIQAPLLSIKQHAISL